MVPMDYRHPVVLFAMAVGGFISRWHGGGIIKGTPKAIKNTLWALPFAVATGQLATWYLAPVAFGLCLAGKATGHGHWFDLGTWKQPADDESLEFLIKGLWNKIPEYWYDVIGMALVGFAAVSGAVFCIAWYNPLAAFIIALGGLFKAPAYMVGWKIGKYPTEIGEVLTGMAAFGACIVAVILV